MIESMKTGKYLVIDTEATSLNIRKGGVIQIAAAALDSNLELLDTIVYDVCPPEGVEIQAEALAVNGFTQDRIDGGISYPEACTKLVEFIDTFFNDRPIAVAHFYPFDWAYLTEMFIRADNIDFKKISKHYFTNRFIDTKAVVMYANTVAEVKGQELPFPKVSLSKKGGIKDILGVSEEHIAHDALGDVMATVEVLRKLISRGLIV